MIWGGVNEATGDCGCGVSENSTNFLPADPVG